MIRNYIKIAFRNILKNKVYSFINIGGLAIGLSAVLLISFYVYFEFSYDTDLKNSQQLYRLNLTSHTDGNLVVASSRTSPAMGSTFTRDISAVENFSRVTILGEAVVGNMDNFIREKDIFIVDENYFDFFNISIRSGSVNLIAEPLKVMLSEEIAVKIFQDSNVVGKTLSINSTNFDGTVDFEIAGTFEPLPANSHLRPQILISYASLHHFMGKEIDESFDWLNLYTYLKLSNSSDIAKVENEINALLQEKHGEKLKTSNSEWLLHLQPVTDIHTNLAYIGEYEQGVDGKKLKYFIWICVFVLVMIYMNSINISNAKAMNRVKEIGVRKVSGGSKKQLFFQFMLESFIINFLSIAIATIIIISLGQPLITLFDLNIPGSALLDYNNLWVLLGLWLFGTLASGLYPALILTSFSPSHALKGSLKYKFRSALARPLIIVQLVICLVILAGTLTVYFQVDHMRKQQLGISLDNKIGIRSPMLFTEGSGNYQKVIHQSLTSLNEVKDVAASNEIPGNEVYWRSNQFYKEGSEKNGAMFTMLNIGNHYFDVFEIKLKAGGYFNKDKEDGSEAIINEKARQALGFKDNESAVGKKLMFSGHGEAYGVYIVGVVDDYRQQGVNVAVNPTVLNYSSGDLNYHIVDIEKGANIKQAVTKIEASFKSLFPTSPFEFYFLDEHFDKQYKSENQFAKLFTLASVISIIIAIMGILGVTTQLILQRNKEISIRKILGASYSHVFYIISKEFMIWLSICYLIGIPLSYLLMSGWLDNFLVRIDLGGWFFVLPGLVVALIFFLSIIFQATKTALLNPANTLKDE